MAFWNYWKTGIQFLDVRCGLIWSLFSHSEGIKSLSVAMFDVVFLRPFFRCHIVASSRHPNQEGILWYFAMLKYFFVIVWNRWLAGMLQSGGLSGNTCIDSSRSPMNTTVSPPDFMYSERHCASHTGGRHWYLYRCGVSPSSGLLGYTITKVLFAKLKHPRFWPQK